MNRNQVDAFLKADKTLLDPPKWQSGTRANRFHLVWPIVIDETGVGPPVIHFDPLHKLPDIGFPHAGILTDQVVGGGCREASEALAAQEILRQCLRPIEAPNLTDQLSRSAS